MKFQKSDMFRDKIEMDFVIIKDKILKVVNNVEVMSIGGAAIPGALTKGDLDVVIRVGRKKFPNALKALAATFKVHHKEMWNEDFAIFKDVSYSPKVDILVTVIGSKSDNLHKIQELLKENGKLLEEYNEIKLEFIDSKSKEYKIAKRRFYNKLRKILGFEEETIFSPPAGRQARLLKMI
ncbi:hypothetical protein A2955_04500 [Candidatus Woesebacteria bacterium RIFCSPLOWO2_01_FULL_37_19]|uniref:Uncharacterized protein n=1 Tax=Candidatus Woesebacteria bacterium RIFCSPLOWO2_01_FULL_37_19 TaxID=1802514 RepID=A0A1F8B5B2_9BACT|nr:MAG: hypothetical protein A2955_04500 [Candidatus Woesebacteria bacterium RIFCSPLOWO2_01_FULL_37_19]